MSDCPLASTNKEFESDILHVLGNVIDKHNYLEALNNVFNSEIKLQNRTIILRSAGKNFYNNDLLWIFVKENWDKIYLLFENNQFGVSGVMESLVHLIDNQIIW